VYPIVSGRGFRHNLRPKHPDLVEFPLGFDRRFECLPSSPEPKPMRLEVLALLPLLAAAGPAHAEPLAALTENGRYQLMEINDKVVRLDTATGRFELCGLQAGEWTCLVAEDERERLADTIDALSRRVGALEKAERERAAELQRVADAETAAPTVAQGGAPMDISPVPMADADPGLIKRITGLIPTISW
jgi:hypothetical protein